MIDQEAFGFCFFFQAQLNRIALLGRLVTPKPRSGYRSPPSQITPKPDLSPHRPYIPKPPPPTASYSNSVQPPKPSELSSSSSGFIPHPEHSTDTRAQHEGQWPFESRSIIENIVAM